MKVTPPQIRAALKACNGKVSEASVILGIARPNLYKRMAALGIDPDEFRPERRNMSPATEATRAVAHDEVTGVTPTVPVALGPHSVAVSSGVILTDKRRGPTLVRMADAATIEPEAERPKRLRITRSFYLRPDQAKAIDEACLDLPAALREPMSPSKVVERFIDDCFVGWLARMKKQPAKRNGRKGEK